MSTQITTAFVQQYSANIQMLSQQMGSLLRDKVRLESVTGKNAFFDQVGSVTAVLKTSRHSDTPQIDTPHARRRVSLGDYEFADLIDQQDKVRLLIDPTSSYAQAAAMAMGRAMDDVIIDAALGTAFTGNTIKALAQGEINSFLGFNFIVSNRLALSSTTRSCIAYAQDGIALAVGKDVNARIDERADKSYATQVYYCMSIGATRMEEAKVVEVQCTE
jgi:hypothetical protein